MENSFGKYKLRGHFKFSPFSLGTNIIVHSLDLPTFVLPVNLFYISPRGHPGRELQATAPLTSPSICQQAMAKDKSGSHHFNVTFNTGTLVHGRGSRKRAASASSSSNSDLDEPKSKSKSSSSKSKSKTSGSSAAKPKAKSKQTTSATRAAAASKKATEEERARAEKKRNRQQRYRASKAFRKSGPGEESHQQSQYPNQNQHYGHMHDQTGGQPGQPLYCEFCELDGHDLDDCDLYRRFAGLNFDSQNQGQGGSGNDETMHGAVVSDESVTGESSTQHSDASQYYQEPPSGYQQHHHFHNHRHQWVSDHGNQHQQQQQQQEYQQYHQYQQQQEQQQQQDIADLTDILRTFRIEFPNNHAPTVEDMDDAKVQVYGMYLDLEADRLEAYLPGAAHGAGLDMDRRCHAWNGLVRAAWLRRRDRDDAGFWSLLLIDLTR